MKLFYFTSLADNFGDELNPVLWERVVPGYGRSDVADWLVGIGTILDERLLALEGKILILGSGFRPSEWRPEIQANWQVAFVRGPLTAKVLDMKPEDALSDPALLVPGYFKAAEQRTEAVGFMPHYHTFQRVNCVKACEAAGITLIPPNLDVDETVRMISSMDRVVVEALHGAIVADAMGVPWVRIRGLSWKLETEPVSAFKWADWAMSMNLEHHTEFQANIPLWRNRGGRVLNLAMSPLQVRGLEDTIRQAANSKHFQLSEESWRAEITERMEERAREAFRNGSGTA